MPRSRSCSHTASGWGGASPGHRATGPNSTPTSGFSSSLAQTSAAIAPILDDLPPVAFRNANDAGTDIYGYLTELFGFTAFALQDGAVYQTYSTTGRGIEFLMLYYGFLDRTPKGRDEDEGFQLWIRRHDEYDSE